MYCVRKVTNDLYWVGANDHRLALFENCFPIPRGVSYNAYCLLDEKTVADGGGLRRRGPFHLYHGRRGLLFAAIQRRASGRKRT